MSPQRQTTRPRAGMLRPWRGQDAPRGGSARHASKNPSTTTHPRTTAAVPAPRLGAGPTRDGMTMAGIYLVKPAFQRSLAGIERWLVDRRVHPDWLTYAALVLSVVGG